MKLFVQTISFEFCNRVASTYVLNFNKLILVGEQIETGLRDGWFDGPISTSKRFIPKKAKELEAEINVAYSQPNHNASNQTLAIQISIEQEGWRMSVLWSTPNC